MPVKMVKRGLKNLIELKVFDSFISSLNALRFHVLTNLRSKFICGGGVFNYRRRP